jgi:hypothetical protein
MRMAGGFSNPEAGIGYGRPAVMRGYVRLSNTLMAAAIHSP